MRWLRSALAVLAFWLVLAVPVGAADLAWALAVSSALGLWAVRSLWMDDDPGLRMRQLPGLAGHLVRLLRAVVPAALQLIGILLRRRLRLRPTVFSYTTSLQGAAARVALANSITLTPGTHCVDVRDDVLTVHCLDPDFADSLLLGDAERDIRRVFEGGSDR